MHIVSLYPSAVFDTVDLMLQPSDLQNCRVKMLLCSLGVFVRKIPVSAGELGHFRLSSFTILCPLGISFDIDSICNIYQQFLLCYMHKMLLITPMLMILKFMWKLSVSDIKNKIVSLMLDKNVNDKKKAKTKWWQNWNHQKNKKKW